MRRTTRHVSGASHRTVLFTDSREVQGGTDAHAIEPSGNGCRGRPGGHGAPGLQPVLGPEGEDGAEGRERRVRRPGLPQGDSEVRRGDQPRSRSSRRRTSTWRTATTTSGSPPRRARPPTTQLLTKAIDGYKTAAEKSEDPKLKKLSLEYLVAAYRDKLEDPSQAEPVVERMIRDGAERAHQLLRAVEDLRGRRQVRGGGGDARQGPRGPAERPDGVHAAGRLLQPPGPVRQDDRVARGAGARGSRTTRSPTTPSRPTTGTRRSATSA